MTCAAPTTYTKCDTKSAVRNWPAIPGGICIGMYFRNGFSPKTTEIRPSKIRAINTAIFIFGSSPNQSIHEGAGTLRAPTPHSMSNERLLWKFVLEPICSRTAFYQDLHRHSLLPDLGRALLPRNSFGDSRRNWQFEEFVLIRLNHEKYPEHEAHQAD